MLSRTEISQALERLGELAVAQNIHIELLLVGGAAMVLLYNARLSTRDLDVIILRPRQPHLVRALASQVAEEYSLPLDWLNDGVKGFVASVSHGPTLLSSPGILVRTTSVEQLLAMKLSAWRDDVDIADATRLLQEITGERATIWKRMEPYLIPGLEMKAEYAFLDLWESLYGEN
ncbi:MAG: hypothetical protein DWI57_06885 [Chloroflexi bacterium]|nr:MAG: hypothetical protein DWI57_06885 [Chloroflexota bacterium]